MSIGRVRTVTDGPDSATFSQFLQPAQSGSRVRRLPIQECPQLVQTRATPVDGRGRGEAVAAPRLSPYYQV